MAIATIAFNETANAQQARLPQDFFGQLAVGVNTRVGTRIGSDWSGSIEALVGSHRQIGSFYRPFAFSGGVTRLFVPSCEVQTLGDCLRPANPIPWLTVMTGVSRRRQSGTFRIMGGIGAAYAQGDLANSASFVPAFETRIDYLVFPRERIGGTIFFRSLTVTNRNARQANGFAIGMGVAGRQ